MNERHKKGQIRHKIMGDTDKYDGGALMPDVDYKRAGWQLQAIRKHRGLDLRDIVEELQVVTTQLDLKPLPLELLIRIERGRLPPHKEHIKYLENALYLKQHELHIIFGYGVPEKKESIVEEPSPYNPNAETDRYDRDVMRPSNTIDQ
jgi:transcriptional regulator with XRE-family HTH domain